MTEFRWADSGHLNSLWILAVIVIVTIFYDRKQRMQIAAVFNDKLYSYLTSTVSSKRRWAKRSLEWIAIVLFILAWARPQLGNKREEIFNEGIEILIMADVSNSMLVEDVGSSRLELLKKTLNRFILKGGGDRIGIVIFAGSAVLISPMTSDKSVLTMYIESLSPEMISSQGTSFVEALTVAYEAFKRGGSQREEGTVVTQAILIASDGEDHEPGAIARAEDLGVQGIRVFTLGFGSESGGKIPMRGSRGLLSGYQKDKMGKEIVAGTNFSILKDLSQAGRGNFYEVKFGRSVVTTLISDLNELDKAKYSSSETTSYKEMYQWFLSFGFLAGLLALTIRERKIAVDKWMGRMVAS